MPSFLSFKALSTALKTLLPLSWVHFKLLKTASNHSVIPGTGIMTKITYAFVFISSVLLSLSSAADSSEAVTAPSSPCKQTAELAVKIAPDHQLLKALALSNSYCFQVHIGQSTHGAKYSREQRHNINKTHDTYRIAYKALNTDEAKLLLADQFLREEAQQHVVFMVERSGRLEVVLKAAEWADYSGGYGSRLFPEEDSARLSQLFIRQLPHQGPLTQLNHQSTPAAQPIVAADIR